MPELDLAAFRSRLTEERVRVVAAIDYLEYENAGSMEDEGEEGGIGNHLAETASATLDREIDYSLEENSAHVLTAIDDALTRIDAGTFGKCLTCGKEIDRDRLEALPYATQCIDCQRREERG